jgi:hypothetical protein
MATNVACSDCGVEYQRGRGRPAKVPLCSSCTNARWRNTEAGKLAKSIKVTKVSADLDERPSVREPKKGLTARADISERLLPDENKPALHGAAGQAVTQPCPSCGYAYADGGYCEDCGWSRDLKRHPYGSITGKKL